MFIAVASLKVQSIFLVIIHIIELLPFQKMASLYGIELIWTYKASLPSVQLYITRGYDRLVAE